MKRNSVVNEKVKPLLKLSRAAGAYWQIITSKKVTHWDDPDNLMACVMCRDHELLEELIRLNPEHRLTEICRRVYDGSRLLRLDRSVVAALGKQTMQTKIVEMIFKGF